MGGGDIRITGDGGGIFGGGDFLVVGLLGFLLGLVGFLWGLVCGLVWGLVWGLDGFLCGLVFFSTAHSTTRRVGSVACSTDLPQFSPQTSQNWCARHVVRAESGQA